MSESKEDARHAEQGYRTAGLSEIIQRDWFSLLEREDPASEWLKKFDPDTATGVVVEADVVVCDRCGHEFLSQGRTGQRKTWCSDRCGRNARMGRYLKGGGPERSDRIRKYKTRYMAGWRANNKERHRQNQRNTHRRAAARKRDVAPPLTCADCTAEFSPGHSGYPRPLRCPPCRRERDNDLARQARRKNKDKRDRAPVAFKTNDFVVWTSENGFRSTKHGVIVSVVPAFTPSNVSVGALGFSFSPDKRKKHGDRARDHESYLVLVGRALYWPPVAWLRHDPEGVRAPVPKSPKTEPARAPDPAPAATRGDVIVRKRKAA